MEEIIPEIELSDYFGAVKVAGEGINKKKSNILTLKGKLNYKHEDVNGYPVVTKIKYLGLVFNTLISPCD